MFIVLLDEKDILIKVNRQTRSYNLSTSVNITDNNCTFIDSVKNHKFYQLLSELNKDMFEDIKIQQCGNKENIQLRVKKNTHNDIINLSSVDNINFINETLVIDEDNIHLIGEPVKNKKNVMELKYINGIIGKKQNTINIEIKFQWTGPRKPYFIEDFFAHMLNKILFKLKQTLMV